MASFGRGYQASVGIATSGSPSASYVVSSGHFAIVQVGLTGAGIIEVGGVIINVSTSGNPITGIYVGPGQTIFAQGATDARITGVDFVNT